jgi:hypothetical protein
MNDNIVRPKLRILSITVTIILVVTFTFPDMIGKTLGQIHKAYLTEMQSVGKK